jgi:hypothetical protein
MRAYYVDPGSSKYQVGKIIAIDVAKMKVYKSIDYPEHRNDNRGYGFIFGCY